MKYSHKIRIRSDKELKMENMGLKELSEILKKKKIKHFITGGTLLGAIREQQFIKWDWDVEITILTDQVFNLKNKLNKLFIDNGFKVIKRIDKFENLKWELSKYNCTYEIIGFYKDGKWMYRLGKGMRVPAVFFSKQSKLFFLGNLYKTVSNPIKYLEFCYGDWQIPKRTYDKKKYLTSNHVPKLKIHNILIQKIKNFFIKVKKI